MGRRKQSNLATGTKYASIRVAVIRADSARRKSATRYFRAVTGITEHVSEDEQVAPRLIATADELEKLARSATAEIRAQSGWRHDIFGARAIKLMSGKLALSISGNAIKIIEL